MTFIFQFFVSCLEPPEEECEAECDDEFRNGTNRQERFDSKRMYNCNENSHRSAGRVAGKTQKAWYYGRKSGDKP